jgi:hypothetical protein
MLPLFKVNLDSTDRSYVPPIWFLHHHKCVHTYIRFVHYDFSATITALFQRWRFLGSLSFISTHLHTHLASCLFSFFKIPYDAQVESDYVYTRLFVLLAKTIA